MEIAYQDLDRLAERLAAQGRVDQETAITRIDLLGSQLHAEAPISRGRSPNVLKLRLLAKGYGGGFLIQQIWLDAYLLKDVVNRQTCGAQPFGSSLCPNG